MFSAVFGAGAARDAYVALRSRGGPVEVVFRSESPRWLGLPWELMWDPSRPAPVALDRVGISRMLPAVGRGGGSFEVAGERLRVLMVIARPAGSADVGFRMVARPLVQCLEAVRGEVDLVVLRPPTLDRLAEVLKEARAAGEPFQVVHFDGHGALTGRGGLVEQGVLAFETPGGGVRLVPAGRSRGYWRTPGCRLWC